MPTKYILVNDENIVVFIGKEDDWRNSEPNLHWIQVPQETYVENGFVYQPIERVFKKRRLSLPDERARLKDLAIQTYSSKMNALLAGYPPDERTTFAFQMMGLVDYLNGNTESLASIFNRALAQGRRMPYDIMNQRILAKTKQFVYVAGLLLGTKQRFEDQCDAIESYEHVDIVEKEIKTWASAKELV